MDDIEYRLIEGCSGYRVGKDGSVWSRMTKKWRRNRSAMETFGEWHKLTPKAVGSVEKKYLQIKLRQDDGRKIYRYVHNLVLEAFVGPRPEGMEACHWPLNDRKDNRLENLRWDTPQANWIDRLTHGTDNRGERNNIHKLTEADIPVIRRRLAAGESGAQISRSYNVKPGTILDVRKGRTWSWLKSA